MKGVFQRFFSKYIWKKEGEGNEDQEKECFGRDGKNEEKN